MRRFTDAIRILFKRWRGDRTPGPWCRSCGYCLHSDDLSSNCPECGIGTNAANIVVSRPVLPTIVILVSVAWLTIILIAGTTLHKTLRRSFIPRRVGGYLSVYLQTEFASYETFTLYSSGHRPESHWPWNSDDVPVISEVKITAEPAYQPDSDEGFFASMTIDFVNRSFAFRLTTSVEGEKFKPEEVRQTGIPGEVELRKWLEGSGFKINQKAMGDIVLLVQAMDDGRLPSPHENARPVDLIAHDVILYSQRRWSSPIEGAADWVTSIFGGIWMAGMIVIVAIAWRCQRRMATVER